MILTYETYQATPESHGRGTFFFTDCGNRMYNTNNDYMFYHKKLCPACMSKGKQVVLYLRGTSDANNIIKDRR